MDAAAEAHRWLTIAGKLLSTRDLNGSKTFALRARESDPSSPVPAQFLAVVETLTSADNRIGDSLFDWYSILGVPKLTRDVETIAGKYYELVNLLGNGKENGVPLADEAVRVAVEAWGVLGDGTRKWLYDGELGLYLQSTMAKQRNVDVNPLHFTPSQKQPQQQEHDKGWQRPYHHQQQPRKDRIDHVNVDGIRDGDDTDNVVGETFWSVCPYCYYLYEYEKGYENCTLRCENCMRGFHATRVPNPPPVGDGKGIGEESFCCWGFYPLGLSMNKWKRKDGLGKGPGWAPFSPIFACPVNGNGVAGGVGVGRQKRKLGGWGSGPRVYVEDDEAYVDISDDDFGSDVSDDIDWSRTYNSTKRTMGMAVGRRGLTTGRRVLRGENSKKGSWGPVRDVTVVLGLKVNSSKTPGSSYLRKHNGRPTRDTGKLDLNVELSNEAEDHMPAVSAENEQEVPIEGIGFFEGLDEFFSSLPILNGTETEKVKPA